MIDCQSCFKDKLTYNYIRAHVTPVTTLPILSIYIGHLLCTSNLDQQFCRYSSITAFIFRSRPQSFHHLAWRYENILLYGNMSICMPHTVSLQEWQDPTFYSQIHDLRIYIICFLNRFAILFYISNFPILHFYKFTLIEYTFIQNILMRRCGDKFYMKHLYRLYFLDNTG